MTSSRLTSLRASLSALLFAVVAWAAGCGTAKPMIEPAFSARTYTPARIAVLPPDVFFVYDEFGDNDPQKSAAIGQSLAGLSVTSISSELQRRGYQVDVSSRWDGVFAQDGQPLIQGPELGYYANSVLQFANSEAGGGEGAFKQPVFIAPDTAARVGWATQSDAILYTNVKGVSVSSGKRTAQVLGVVFFVVIVAAIILMVAASSKGGGGNNKSLPGTGNRSGGGVARAAAPTPSASNVPRARWGSGAVAPSAPPVGSGRMAFANSGGGRVYRHSGGPHVGVGVGFFVPIGGPAHTHDGQVADSDDTFAGDDLNVSLTLVSASDGRVLWHTRRNVDVDATKPEEVKRMWQSMMGEIPQSLSAGPAPAPAPAAPR